LLTHENFGTGMGVSLHITMVARCGQSTLLGYRESALLIDLSVYTAQESDRSGDPEVLSMCSRMFSWEDCIREQGREWRGAMQLCTGSYRWILLLAAFLLHMYTFQGMVYYTSTSVTYTVFN
jgi:hypothetical protein